MKSKAVLAIIVVVAGVILLAGTFATGLIIGRASAPRFQPLTQVLPLQLTTESAAQALPQNQSVTSPSDQARLDDLFTPFWQAWNIVHNQYVDQPVNDQTMMQGAIKGMMQSLGDQHSSYMNPDEYQQANINMEGEYEGIGAWVDTNAELLTIVTPMPNSPAEKAGLKPGDEILAIDGDDMVGIDGNLVIQRVLGPAGTQVTLTIQRKGVEKPFDVTLTRAKITIPSVESKMLAGNIAYVHLFTFGDRTTGELHTALQELLAQQPTGMILDLRNNGGGALRTAIEVASQFIDQGVIMYEQYGDGTRDTYTALGNGLATKIPLVVLINEGTASASEIVAGAIQDYGRGQLVGVTSFGKGSVQIWTPLDNNQGAVRVTVARWLTPKEHTIHEIGLQPDVVVELTEEDIQAQRDPQLDKAVELFSQP